MPVNLNLTAYQCDLLYIALLGYGIQVDDYAEEHYPIMSDDERHRLQHQANSILHLSNIFKQWATSKISSEFNGALIPNSTISDSVVAEIASPNASNPMQQ